ncbi:hypothetical protein [Flavobacterium sp. SM2513]|uniref:hypothetical protein n=1 Tax=Flavobacterium sp. SM2513 TaxID=3424766 RepID=UPI003D7FD105
MNQIPLAVIARYEAILSLLLGANRLGFFSNPYSRYPLQSPEEKSGGFSLLSGLAVILVLFWEGLELGVLERKVLKLKQTTYLMTVAFYK